MQDGLNSGIGHDDISAHYSIVKPLGRSAKTIMITEVFFIIHMAGYPTQQKNAGKKSWKWVYPD